MLDWINRLFNEYKFVRRSVLYGFMVLLTFVTYQVFWHTKGELAKEYIALTGLLAVVIGLYQWLREREDKL